MNKLSISIIKTLCYAEIFSYPLSFYELKKYLIIDKKITDKELLDAINKTQGIDFSQNFIFLSGSSNLINTRLEREEFSKKKLRKALWATKILSLIPTINLIGVSGSLSMMNAKKEDDIDLFFITKKNTLWITRFAVNIVLNIFAEKRKKLDKLQTDKICPNMFIPEDKLKLSPSARNIYTAHEVAQLKVLYNKNNTYEKFIKSNKWVLKYLYNFSEIKISKKNYNINNLKNSLFNKLVYPLNLLFFIFQYLYMKKSMTNEKVSLNYAFFHPNNTEKYIIDLYNLKIKYRQNTLDNKIKKIKINFSVN